MSMTSTQPLKKPRGPRVVTPAMLAANRRNALRSTGPTAAAGKARSRMNGVTQGAGVRFDGRLPSEDPAARRAFAEARWADFAPATPAEAWLVIELIDVDWRTRRANEAEE